MRVWRAGGSVGIFPAEASKTMSTLCRFTMEGAGLLQQPFSSGEYRKPRLFSLPRSHVNASVIR